jgi:hypothetical protein
LEIETMPRIAVDSGPSGKIVKVTSGANIPLCRALLVGTAGTGTLIDGAGATATDVPLQQGYNPIRCTKVTFGTVNDVWALY